MSKLITYAKYFKDYIKYDDLQSIFQSIQYVVSKKVTSKDRVVQTSIGTFFCRAGSIDFQFANAAYEIDIKNLIVEYIEKGYSTFFDIGACIGEHSINAAKKGAKVFAFDPIPDTYNVLKKNIELNNLSDQIKAFDFGLGEREYLAFFQYDPINTGKSKKVAEKSDISAEIKPLSKVFKELELNYTTPTLFKIDVEGMEADVIEGGLDTFATLDNVFIIFEDKHSDLNAIKQQLNSIGNFEFSRVDNYNMSALKL